MPTTLRLAGRVGLVAVILAVVGSVSACGSTQSTPQPTPTATPTPTPTPTPEPTKSLVEIFTSNIQAADFQAAGPLSGSFSMESQGIIFHVTLSGTIKIKGEDNAQVMKMDIAATALTPANTVTNENITVGDWSYSRTNAGAWTKEARSSSDNIATVFKTTTVEDKGVETHFGQQLHRLESTTPLDPQTFFGDMTGVSDADLTITFWAQDNGTPAGMSIAGTFKQAQSENTFDVVLGMEYAFDSLSGVTIEAPSI